MNISRLHDELAAMSFQHDGVDILKPCFNVLVYWQGSLQEHASGILRFHEKSIELIRDHVRYYRTTWMRRPARVKQDSFTFVPSAVAVDNPNPKEMQFLKLDARANPNAATDRSFTMLALPVLNAGMMRLVLPLSIIREKPLALIRLTEDLIADLKFCWGSAGYSLNYDDMSDFAFYGQNESYNLLMRHPGIDLDNPSGTLRKLEEGAGFGCINWLTILGSEPVNTLGGQEQLRSSLSSDVTIRTMPHGLVFQAGPRPELGGANDPEALKSYHALGRVLAPARLGKPWPFIRVPPKAVLSLDETQKWLGRFDT
jgi:hypothetical protein